MFAPALDKRYRDQSYYSGLIFDKHALKRRERAMG
jgi:hypothetical protein